ncbi:MAG: hypothetical protein Q8Q69_05740 [Nitrosopumilaceae archaeon]|nr:hypothetical protein [Nitrosopumilaceae archaeon]
MSQKPLREWVQEHQLEAENTLDFIDGIEQDVKELSEDLGAKVKLIVEE